VTIDLDALGEISGTIYNDADGDGVQDPEEEGIDGLEVLITDVNGNTQTITTDSNGNYSAMLPPGMITITINEAGLPEGIQQTEGSNPITVNVVADRTVTIENSGFVIPNSNDSIEIFTALSPNGDGINDEFFIKGLDRFPENTLRIFNRWGVQVFEAERYGQVETPMFKGISQGRVTVSKDDQLPVGTYFYILNYLDNNNKNKSISGYLYINR